MNSRAKKLVFVLILGLTACQQRGNSFVTTKEGVLEQVQVVPGNYGEKLSESDVVSGATLLQKITESGRFDGKVSGNIKEVCTSKGCWFVMDLPNGETMRVTFKDYGFFIPTNSQGFPVTIEGIALLKEMDVETRQHYAEDQGKSKKEVDAITSPKKEITFEAIGVLIKAKS